MESWKWLLLLSAPLFGAQEKPKPPRFAIEISDPAGVVVDRRNVAEQVDVTQRLVWRGPALRALLDPQADPAALEIAGFGFAFRSNGDSVTVKAEQYPPSVRPAERVIPVPGRTALLHLNESADFAELTGFHLQPLTVRVIPAKGSLPSLFTVQNKTRTLDLTILEQVDYAGEAMHSFRLKIRNNSKQAAVGVEPCELCQNGKGCAGGGHRDVIPPGETEERTPSNSCGTAARTLSIVALDGAVFEDGTYEGDAEAFAPMAAEVIAARIQSRRIRTLVERILANGAMDDASKLLRIRASVEGLPDKPDKEVLDAMRRPLHAVSEPTRRNAEFRASVGLQDSKRRTLFALLGFERSSSGGGAGKSLADWWAEWSRSL